MTMCSEIIRIAATITQIYKQIKINYTNLLSKLGKVVDFFFLFLTFELRDCSFTVNCHRDTGV